MSTIQPDESRPTPEPVQSVTSLPMASWCNNGHTFVFAGDGPTPGWSCCCGQIRWQEPQPTPEPVTAEERLVEPTESERWEQLMQGVSDHFHDGAGELHDRTVDPYDCSWCHILVSLYRDAVMRAAIEEATQGDKCETCGDTREIPSREDDTRPCPDCTACVHCGRVENIHPDGFCEAYKSPVEEARRDGDARCQACGLTVGAGLHTDPYPNRDDDHHPFEPAAAVPAEVAPQRNIEAAAQVMWAQMAGKGDDRWENLDAMTQDGLRAHAREVVEAAEGLREER